MDISTNELANPSVPVAEAPYMLSKYAKSYLEALTSGQEDIVAKSNAQSAVVKSYVEGEVSRLDTANSNLVVLAQQSTQFAANDRQAIRSSLANAEATLNQTITNEVAALNNIDAGLRTDVDDLLQWRTNNTDEIATEVDKAINAKVSQTAYDAVVAQLQSKDSDLTASLSQAITDRENKDAEHTALLARMEAFANIVLSLNEVQDGDGNVLSSFADISASTSVGIPMSIVADILAEYTRDVSYNITIATVANRDAGKMVRAHFTLPAGVSLSYQEGGQGAYIPLVDVFGPASGFPLGDISSNFLLEVDASGSYSAVVEFKEVDDGNVLASKTLSFDVVEPAPAGPAPTTLQPGTHTLVGPFPTVQADGTSYRSVQENGAGLAYPSTRISIVEYGNQLRLYTQNIDNNTGAKLVEELPIEAYRNANGSWIIFKDDFTYEVQKADGTSGAGTWSVGAN